MTRTTKTYKEEGGIATHRFHVGDLVQSIRYPDLIYMLIPHDFARNSTALPMTVNQERLSGIVVHSDPSKKDTDGDYLPAVGSVHPGFKPEYFQHFKGNIKLIGVRP